MKPLLLVATLPATYDELLTKPFVFHEETISYYPIPSERNSLMVTYFLSWAYILFLSKVNGPKL